MRKALRILVDEHKKILAEIDSLEKACAELSEGGEMDQDFFAKKIDFIRGYADRFHHAKEEDILFAELCRDGVLTHCNPIPQMLHEHNLGRVFVKGMEEGLAERDKDKVIESALGYAQLLREHIYKEDNILYPMADEALSQENQDEMLKKFNEVENGSN